jgi:hypothetical protein
LFGNTGANANKIKGVFAVHKAWKAEVSLHKGRSDRANLSSDLIGSGQEIGEGRTPSDRHLARGLQRNLLLQQKSLRLNHHLVL